MSTDRIHIQSSRDDDSPPDAPSLCLQTVLYGTRPSELSRFLVGASRACALARSEGVLGRTRLAVGDCSPEPVLSGPEALPSGIVDYGFDGAMYQSFGANLGSAGGHNRLFADLSEDLVLVMNPDTYAAPRMIVELLGALSDASVGVVEARQLPLEHPKSYAPGTGDTSWASGSCFLARAEVVEETGGFDPDLFFLYCDDVDFSWRARLAGWRVVHRPSARVFHDKRLTVDGFVEPGEAEIRYSAEAAVLLAWRYSRSDLAMETLRSLESSPDGRHRDVAAGLRARLRAGNMPEPLDPEHRIAMFVDGNYAVHRFSYA